MRAVLRLAASLLLLAAATACARNVPTEAVPSASPAAMPPPQGWRWESFGGVELAVPAGFGYDFGPARLLQWCTVHGRTVPPVVARPGATTLVACPPGPDGVAADTLLTNTGTVVAFGRTGEKDGTTRRGDRTTVRTDGVEVTINAPESLARAIAATVHRAPVDDHGCPATHPVSATPSWRPPDPVAVTARRDVTAVSVCEYEVADGLAKTPGLRLYASQRLDGTAAANAVAGIARTRTGGGPDLPSSCLPEVSWGDKATVLLISSAHGTSPVVLRHSGCDHNGFDDGTAVRRLTRESVAPFITGPTQPLSASAGDEMADVLGLR